MSPQSATLRYAQSIRRARVPGIEQSSKLYLDFCHANPCHHQRWHCVGKGREVTSWYDFLKSPPALLLWTPEFGSTLDSLFAHNALRLWERLSALVSPVLSSFLLQQDFIHLTGKLQESIGVRFIGHFPSYILPTLCGFGLVEFRWEKDPWVKALLYFVRGVRSLHHALGIILRNSRNETKKVMGLVVCPSCACKTRACSR